MQQAKEAWTSEKCYNIEYLEQKYNYANMHKKVKHYKNWLQCTLMCMLHTDLMSTIIHTGDLIHFVQV